MELLLVLAYLYVCMGDSHNENEPTNQLEVTIITIAGCANVELNSVERNHFARAIYQLVNALLFFHSTYSFFVII